MPGIHFPMVCIYHEEDEEDEDDMASSGEDDWRMTVLLAMADFGGGQTKRSIKTTFYTANILDRRVQLPRLVNSLP